MSKKAEVDDAMVKRGAKCLAGRKYTDPLDDLVRAVLEAALTEPPEEEIEVPTFMAAAGTVAVQGRGCWSWLTYDDVTAIYRAMERVRRKAEKPALLLPSRPHCRSSDRGFAAYCHGHRRKDDA